MRLIEALNILKSRQHRTGGTISCFLATGLNPLHLMTFLAVELGEFFTEQKVEIENGLYGDILGNLDRLAKGDREFGMVLIEWPDLDPRLGIRSTARWTASELSDILATARARASRIQQGIEESSHRTPLAVCFPTLPVPPISFAPGWEASSFDLDLRGVVQSLAAAVAQLAQVRILSAQHLDLESPLRERLDVESDCLTGFPYRLQHASILAASFARLARAPVPKKGIITDLDNTLWRGILGEDGVDGVSWDLEHNSQMHAFYQRFLGALASEGVLIGVASKNEPLLVEEALRRKDLALSPDALFPIEASWKPKSQSVTRILERWNVGPDSVVFLDDSPMELAEVRASYSEMECLQFPNKDNAAVYNLTLRLRELFGRSAILEEDSIRLESIRCSQGHVDVLDESMATDFLAKVKAEFTFTFSKTPVDPRALELVNKTNQFNLNGKRYTEASWHNFLSDPSSFLLVASYRDKFGPLGKIAVLAGTASKKALSITSWAMSCRAFSRQIEYKCFAELLARFDPDEIDLDFLRTDRNGPIQEFFSEIFGTAPSSNFVISRQDLDLRLENILRPQEVMNG